MKKALYLIFSSLVVIILAACGATESDTIAESNGNNNVVSSDGIALGSEAPAFTLADAAGGEVSLADYSGQPVLLYFHMAVG